VFFSKFRIYLSVPVHPREFLFAVYAIPGQFQPGEAGHGSHIVAAAAVGYSKLCGGIPGFKGAGVTAVRGYELDSIAMSYHQVGMVRRRSVPGHCEGSHEVLDACDRGAFPYRLEDPQSTGYGNEPTESRYVADAPQEDGLQLQGFGPVPDFPNLFHFAAAAANRDS